MKLSAPHALLLSALSLLSATAVPSWANSTNATPLLRLAFDGVSLMPDTPHQRDRCAAQDRLAESAIELGQLDLASAFADQIANWRRARLYADLATAHARRDDAATARSYLNKAQTMTTLVEAIAAGEVIPAGDKKVMADSLQEWRLDRVKARMATAYLLLEAPEEAAEIGRGVDDDERAGIDVALASVSARGDFDEVVGALTAIAEQGDFEPRKQALGGLLELHDRYFMEAEKRKRLETLIVELGANMPLFLRIGYAQTMAETAIERGDAPAAVNWLEDADEKLEATGFRPRMYFPMKSRGVVLFHAADLDERAREGAARMEAVYAEKRNEVFDIHRANLLCRVAEAYAAWDDADRVNSWYSRAIVAGQLNGNARPRADDLADIARSIAASPVAPSSDVVVALEEMKSRLGDPW